jgi:selenium metabolism protein YedF
MKTVDARGQSCPIPLIMTKKAINSLSENEVLEILLDNEVSVKNVIHFLKEHKMPIHEERQGDIFRLLINKVEQIPEDTNVEEYCEIQQEVLSNYVMTIKRNRMGDGADELGEILIKAAINTIPDMDIKPNKMIFFNSGILMTLNDSAVLESLKKLENIGIEILVCGTCLDYYQKKDELGVGRISNMYDILDSMSKASKVVFL